jgi:hypothetical protein
MAYDPNRVATCKFWLEPSTLSGNPVASWGDSRGDFDVSHGTAGNQPALVAGYTGALGAADFDGADDHLFRSYGNGNFSTASKGMFSAVATLNDAADRRTLVSCGDTAANNYLSLFVETDDTVFVFAISGGGGTYAIYPANTIPAGQKCVICFGNSGSAFFLMVNGVLQTPSSTFGTAKWFDDMATTDDKLTVGGTHVFSSGGVIDTWDGPIGELLYHDDLNPTDDQSGAKYIVEGLMTKHGLKTHTLTLLGIGN